MNSPIQLNMHTHSRFAGRYKLSVHKEKSGTIVTHTGWFNTLITYQGLDQIGNPPVFNTVNGYPYINTHCAVGTGTTPPALTDTAMEAQVAMFPSTAGGNVNGGANSYVAASGPTPAYYRCVWVYTFAAGTATGNLSEVGVGGTLNGDTTPRLFSHALIVDGSGNPTTITVLSDEVLTVTYELRLYIDPTDSSYSFFINTTSYSGTVRRSIIATAANIDFSVQNTPSGVIYIQCYNGSIGTVTGGPSGSGDSSNAYDEVSQFAYVTGNYYRDFRRSIPISIANINISALQTRSPHGRWQFSVSPAIPKTSSVSLQLNWRQSWGFYP